jgi:hypothetical protein
MAFRTFHIDYDASRGGQVGDDDSLIGALDAYGAGLERSGELTGGPLLIRLRSSDDLVVGWIRSKGEREGTYEAWGVTGPQTEDVSTWVSYWPMFKEYRCDDLKAVASGMTQRKTGNIYPAVPDNLASELTRIAAAYDRGERTFVTAVNSAVDLELLPWLWLLGPVESCTATVGPPRQSPLSLTYQGQVGAVPICPEPERWALEIVNYLHADEVESGMKQARSLRGKKLNPSQLAPALSSVKQESAAAKPADGKAAAAIVAAAANPGPDHPFTDETNVKPGWIKKVWRRRGGGIEKQRRLSLRTELRGLRLRLNVALMLLGAILLINAYPHLWQTALSNQVPNVRVTQPQVLQPSSSPPPSRSDNSNIAETDTAYCASSFGSLVDQRRLAEAFVKRLAARSAPATQNFTDFLKALREGQRLWTPAERRRVIGAAVQLYLNQECLTSSIRIDGVLGETSKTALERCRQTKTVPVTSEEGALGWLCTECAHLGGR